MTGSPQQALAFLRRIYPDDMVVITAIEPDAKAPIVTSTFTPERDGELLTFLKKYNGSRNLYFGVNPPVKPQDKKAGRENIRCMAMLHVDLDPRAGEDLDAERARILALLTTELPAGVLPPSIILFSGGGYQAFWKLAEPLPLDGDVSKADAAARYNMQLEVLLGGDATHDVSRIMRVPYTLNLPSEKKKKKGRSVVMADVIEFHEDRVYSLDQFTPAPAVQSAEPSGKQVEISGNVAQVSIDDLDQWGVPGWCKALIVQGKDIDNPEKYPSRSEAVFAVCCELARRQVPDDVIFSVLTDSDFGISESILEKGPNRYEAYATKQISSAKDAAIDPWLAKLNAAHAVIKHCGGDTCVVTEIFDPGLNRHRVSRWSFEAFKKVYMNVDIQVGANKNGPVFEKAGKWWLSHPRRREYEMMVFVPGREIPNMYNLWKGFKYEAKPGDCSLFLSHVRENICQGNEEHFNYLMGWMARAVQKPGAQGEVAVVLRGDQGTGKSFLANHFGSLFGRHFMKVSQPSHIVGNFNGHLQDCVVLFADEGFFAGDKRHASVLKDLITGDTLTIEHKGYNIEQQPNFLHVIMASNSDWIVPAGANERRYFVLDVGQEHMQDSQYFARIADQLKSGGYEALLYTLLRHDISEFNVRDVPQTDALRHQKILTQNAEENWWLEKLRDGKVLSKDADWSTLVGCDDLYADYLEAAGRTKIIRPLSKVALGLAMKRMLPGEFPGRKQQRDPSRGKERTARGNELSGYARRWMYTLPTLTEARAYFDAHFGGPFDWADAEVTEAPGTPEKASIF